MNVYVRTHLRTLLVACWKNSADIVYMLHLKYTPNNFWCYILQENSIRLRDVEWDAYPGPLLLTRINFFSVDKQLHPL